MSSDENQNDLILLKQVPIVLRARGFRLYTANGRRLIDLWLNGGAAILGHTPPNMLRELKNTASRGLYAPFPHFTEERLKKALLKLFPQHNFRLYSSPPEELILLFKSKDAKIWRPFTNPESPFETDHKEGVFIPALPGIQAWRNELPFGLCIAAAKSETQLESLQVSENLSPILLAMAARGIYDLLASPERGKPKFPRVFKALKNSIWERKGIYLSLKKETNAKEWGTLFCHFLEKGFLLPPNPSQPIILPGELSDGEEAKLASCLIQMTSP